MVICSNSMTEMKDNSSVCNSSRSQSSSSHHHSSNKPTTTATTPTPTTTTTILRGSVHHRLSRNMSVLIQNKRNTKAEFKRLKTILPSIRRKENVSKLDIILEAIKYIDDLQDQLFDRLGGPRGDREATILALTTATATTQVGVDADRLKDVGDDVDVDDEMIEEIFEDDEEEEDLISLSDGYMSDPGLAMLYHDDADDDDDQESDGDCSSGVSNASLEL